MKKYIPIILSAIIFLIGPFQVQAQVITTIAGTGEANSFYGDGGPAILAAFNQPSGVTIDAMGNLFIADQSNGRIRKINTSGIINTFAGGGTIRLGDGDPATSASLGACAAVAIDKVGDIYIADNFNARIRKVDTFGIISTIAGNSIAAMGGYNGDGFSATAAELNYPTGVTIDNIGNVYIADDGNNRIRKVDTFGIISTFAGNGSNGYSADGIQATAAQLTGPGAVTFDNSGNLLFTDGNLVRKIDITGTISTVAGGGTGLLGDGGPATAAYIDPMASVPTLN